MPVEHASSGLTIREATSDDNDAIIALELYTPLAIGDVAETFNRSPDAFACCRLHQECHIAVAEVDGGIVGLMAGVMIRPTIQGTQRSLVYIHRARVDPEARHQRVAWSLSNHLFAWGGGRGAAGPCYMIAPENSTSLAFVERGGGRWPTDFTTLNIDTSDAQRDVGDTLSEQHLPEAIALINATHDGSDFFEPRSLSSLISRLNRNEQYGIRNLRGVFDDGQLVAVGGFLDRGAHTERIDTDTRTGDIVRSRRAAIIDWGFAPGHERAFARLVECLALEARSIDRPEISICEPFPGAVPTGLRYRRSAISLFTPSFAPPDAASMRGLYFDLLNL